ncbi:MAG: hypothetical protein MUO54_16345 [Anaerolineales bacterium]|nr:hypothetical protein [Anaerolineales bacterium]
MLSKVRHIHALTSIRRERVLPQAGHVLVRRLQKVTPTDVIVIASLNPKYILFEIALGLNVTPVRADELLQRRAGDDLTKGDVIAGPVGLFQRVIRAPQSGVVRIAGEGKVLFEISSPPFELQAGMEGTVTNIIPERGAIIETRGALIQGVWGNGNITYGVMQPVSNNLNQELLAEQINISFRGAILAAGYCSKPDVLKIAATIPIKGLVLGSISSDLLQTAQAMKYPILVIDGFGTKPMNSEAEEILVANKDRNVALNAQVYDPFTGKVPEIIISQPNQPEPELPIESESLVSGKRVIIVNGSQAPQIGKIDLIHSRKKVLPSGIETRTAEVIFGNEKRATISLTNFEILKG